MTLGLSLTSTLRLAEQERDLISAERDRVMAQLLAANRRVADLAERLEPLCQQMAAWVTNKAGEITPEQAAQMFYAQDDTWQATFFNVMQAQIVAYHETAGGVANYGVPAGEGQWWHVAGKLDDSGFETLTAMHEHAVYYRERAAA